MKLKFTPLAIALALFLAFGCKSAGDCCLPPEPCTETIGCTEVFISVTVDVQGTLDSAFVTNNDTNERILSELLDPNYSPDYYVIANDGDMESISFDGTQFLFEGWVDGSKVIEENFVIMKDCCHISKVSGVEKIVVD